MNYKTYFDPFSNPHTKCMREIPIQNVWEPIQNIWEPIQMRNYHTLQGPVITTEKRVLETILFSKKWTFPIFSNHIKIVFIHWVWIDIRGRTLTFGQTLTLAWHWPWPNTDLGLTLTLAWHWPWPDTDLCSLSLTLTLAWHWPWPNTDLGPWPNTDFGLTLTNLTLTLA